MKKITIMAIVTAILCSCSTTKNTVAKNTVAKKELVEVINVFNNDVVDDYIDSVSVYNLHGRRIIKLHAEQADELVLKTGIYIVVIKSAKGLNITRKVCFKEDVVLRLGTLKKNHHNS